MNYENPNEFTLLYRETYKRLHGYCSLFIKDSQQAEDLIHDCFETLWKNKSSIDPSKSIESLLFVMLRNKCLNYLKDIHLSDKKTLKFDDNINEIQYLYQLDFLNKEEASLEEQMVQSLKLFIEELPPKRKEVFNKCKIEGCKQKEIAEELGISLKMVEKHLSQAKTQLKTKLLVKYPTLSLLIISIFQ